MPVFTALRNKARSTASGFLTKTAQNALGLNRAKGLRFNQPNTGPQRLLHGYSTAQQLLAPGPPRGRIIGGGKPLLN